MSRIKRDEDYQGKPDANLYDLLGKGGQMMCLCCGQTTNYSIESDGNVSCVCGWHGDYNRMVFVKELSERGVERTKSYDEQYGKRSIGKKRKLTDEEVLAIKKMREDNFELFPIAKKYGTSISTISLICSNKIHIGI